MRIEIFFIFIILILIIHCQPQKNKVEYRDIVEMERITWYDPISKERLCYMNVPSKERVKTFLGSKIVDIDYKKGNYWYRWYGGRKTKDGKIHYTTDDLPYYWVE